MRRQTEEAIEDSMRGHEDTVEIRVFRHPLELGDAADIAGVGSDDAHGLLLDQFHEVLAQVNLLTGVSGAGGAPRDLTELVGGDIGYVVAGDQVLEPQDVERL